MQGGTEELKTPEVLREENRVLLAKVRALEGELKFRMQQVQALLRRIYGRRSERVVSGQLDLLVIDQGTDGPAVTADDTDAAEDSADSDPKRRKKRNGRGPLPENLPRKREEFHPPEEERICKCCAKEMAPIGEEVTEELEYIPSQVYVRELARIKYGCSSCQQGVVIAELPPRPIEKGRPGPGLLAHCAVSKYGDHLPLNRQEAIFARQGVDISRKTICDWLGAAASLLQPIVGEMKRQLFEEKCLQADETPVQYRDPEVKGATQRGYMWVYGIPWREVILDFTENRSRDGPLRFLSSYRGYLQTDGYAGYNELFRTGRVIHIACLATSDGDSMGPAMRRRMRVAWSSRSSGHSTVSSGKPRN